MIDKFGEQLVDAARRRATDATGATGPGEDARDWARAKAIELNGTVMGWSRVRGRWVVDIRVRPANPLARRRMRSFKLPREVQ